MKPENELVGKNIFDVVFEKSKSVPVTLYGTNNNRWVVYYADIDITFTTNKLNQIITKVEKGKHPIKLNQ